MLIQDCLTGDWLGEEPYAYEEDGGGCDTTNVSWNLNDDVDSGWELRSAISHLRG